MSISEFVNHDDDFANRPCAAPATEFVGVERGDDGTVAVECLPYPSGKPTRFVFCPADDGHDMKELFRYLDRSEIIRMFRAVDQLSDVIPFERAMNAVREAVLAEHLENEEELA